MSESQRAPADKFDPKAEAAGFGMSPYCAMANNPIANVDPDGDIFIPLLIGAATGVLSNGLSNISQGNSFFAGAGKAALWGGVSAIAGLGIGQLFGNAGGFGKELLRAGSHAAAQGGISLARGGSFWQGALSGGLSSGIGSGIDGLFGGHGAEHILGGALSGGIGSAISGGNFFEGMYQGLAVGAFNHAMHSAVGGKNGGGPGDPPTKEEMKVYLAGEFLAGRISQREYINAITLIDDGPWGLLMQVVSNNKYELAMTLFPVGRLGMLGRYFASLEQLASKGIVIARGSKIDDLPRLIATYGGKASDWTKVVSSTTYKGKDGLRFSTHWYEKAGTRIEIKTVLGR